MSQTSGSQTNGSQTNGPQASGSHTSGLNTDAPQKVVHAFAWFIVGVWVYCLVVAPIFVGGDYLTVAWERAKGMGFGFTAIALVIGTVWYLIEKNSQGNKNA